MVACRLEKAMKKLRSNESTNKEDSFSCLSDDLLILILSKLKELKHMCVCSLVCKRFASMAAQIQSVHLTCPVREIFVAVQCGYIESLTIPKMNFITFLEKFKKLEFIYLEFTCPRNNTSSPKCLNWKAKCEKGGTSDSFVCQLLESVLTTAQDQRDGGEQENQEDYSYSLYSIEFILQSTNHGLNVFVSCVDCIHLLSIIVQRLCSLKRVTVRDFEKQGKLILEDEQLVMWRNSLVSEERFDVNFMNLTKKIAFQAVWRFPLRGCMLKVLWVRGMLLKITIIPEDVGEREIMYELGFEGDENIIDEVTVNNYQSCGWTYYVPAIVDLGYLMKCASLVIIKSPACT